MKKLLIVLTLLSGAAFAQSTKVPSVDGNPASGDCVKWTSGRTLGSTGTPCNSGTGFTMAIPSPAIADTGVYQHKVARQYTIQRISCSTDAGTVSINFDIRNESSPNDPGNPVLSTPLVCSSATASTVTLANPVVLANSPVALVVTATNGTPTVVRIHVSTQIQ
jgi:hypothetical protein